jgi:hypothetical protein
MSGPKRNPDKLNTIGVVVVGVCGAVLTYVTIVGLQAFYVNDTSEIQTMADYHGQDKTAKGRKADELRNITEVASNGAAGTFRIHIDDAIKKVIEDAKVDPAHLVPALPRSDKATIEPQFTRGKPLEGPKATEPAPAPEGAPPAPGTPPAAPTVPTGAPAPAPAAPKAAAPAPAPAAPKAAAPAPAPAAPKAAAPAPAPAAPKAAAPAPAPAAPKAAAPAPAAPKAAAPAPAPKAAQPKAAPAPAPPAAPAPKTP